MGTTRRCRFTVLLILGSTGILTVSCQSVSTAPPIQPVAASPKETPSSQNSFVAQGNQYAKDGLLREAVDSYKKAIQKDPKNMLAFRNLGIVLLKAGDLSGSIQNLEKSLGQFEDNFEANYYLGEALRMDEKLSEAIFRFNKALKIQPDDPRALKSLAWSYYKIRYYSEATTLAQKLQKSAPEDEQAYMILARTQLKLRRENEALTTIKRGLERTGKTIHPFFFSLMAEIYVSQGKTQDAMELWKKALKDQPLLASALLGVGRILLEQGQLKDASDYLERAVRVKPKMYEGYYWLARSLETTNPERSLRNFNVFRRNAAHDPDFIDLIQDTKKRTASLTTRSKMETP